MKQINPKISVVICTFGQCIYFKRIINALRKQTIKQFQLVIVDNNSCPTDFSNLIQSLNDVKIIHLPKPNLSIARNTAINKCNGDWILFLDDDAIPDTNWIEKIINGFKEYGSDMIGGRVELCFQKKEPKWFTKVCRLYLSELTYYNDDIEVVIPPRYLVGTNMAFSKKAFNKFGLFLKDSGRIGKKLISLEDVEMVRRIYNQGGKVTYLNSAKVNHIIPKSRMTISYLIKRAFWQGISDIMLENIQPLNQRKQKKLPLNFTLFLEIVRGLGSLFYRIKKH
ncbi:glycosyltransferase [Patescibacteria group bacterium]|nr:glycosyltransferase [Patescibacteria group bacterium]